MSIASWYLIVSKSIEVWRTQKAFRDYVKNFWNASTLAASSRLEHKTALANLAWQAITAAEHHKAFVAKNADKVTQDEFIARAMNRTIAEENSKMEQGLTVLASVGSVSPFVGLFGTVWGIYHALASISLSGQATLDKVAGPVGEALIMTALGLAVAIPAVLAYNALVRSNRELNGVMEKFGYELHTLLTTGAVMAAKQNKVNSALDAKEHMTKERIHSVEVPA
jgi:biopolymer transport protein ExbB